MRPVAKVTSVLLLLVALAHVLRLAFRVEVLVGGDVVPMWISVVGTLVPCGLAVALWRESSR